MKQQTHKQGTTTPIDWKPKAKTWDSEAHKEVTARFPQASNEGTAYCVFKWAWNPDLPVRDLMAGMEKDGVEQISARSKGYARKYLALSPLSKNKQKASKSKAKSTSGLDRLQQAVLRDWDQTLEEIQDYQHARDYVEECKSELAEAEKTLDLAREELNNIPPHHRELIVETDPELKKLLEEAQGKGNEQGDE